MTTARGLGSVQSPERHDFAVTRTSVIRACRSTAFTMSMTVRAATLTAVRASISMPVRSAVRTVADVDALVDDGEVHLDAVHGDGVRQRDEVRGALHRLYAGHARPRARRPWGRLGGSAATASAESSTRPRALASGGDVLAGHVDHVGRSVGADVGQPALGHGASAPSSGRQSSWSPSKTSVTSE